MYNKGFEILLQNTALELGFGEGGGGYINIFCSIFGEGGREIQENFLESANLLPRVGPIALPAEIFILPNFRLSNIV